MGRELDEITKEVREFIARIRDIKIDKAILFGSWVSGDWMEWSDVDLILVSSDFEGKFFTDRPVELYEYWKGERSVELFCYTPEEFEKKRRQIGFVAEAEKSGIVIK